MTFREDAAAKLAPVLAPIPGANPVGADVSYDPDFERMKAEIDKLSSVDGTPPSWSDVASLAWGTLSGKSKDIRVASWMIVAKLKTEGWKGFAEALLAYDGIARAYWDTMYPDVKRAKARVNVFSWMADLVAQHLQGADVSVSDGDAVRACDETLNELDRFLADKLGDLYAGPGTLRSLMREKVRAIPEPVRAPEPTTDASAQASPDGANGATAPAAAQPATATSVQDVDQVVRANAQAIADAASILRASDPARPWSYRLKRLAVWIAVEEAPTSEDGKTTLLPAPPEADRRQLAGLRERERWGELLAAAEEATGNYLFWLDAHRMVALALDKLGHTAARDAVGSEVTAFLARVPVVADLAFSDGTPFAETGTKKWLTEEAKRLGAGGGGSAAAAAVSAEDEEVAKRLAEASQMVMDGKVAQGLALASALASRAPDARMRFRAQLAVGRLAIDGSRPDLARPMLERLLEDIQRHSLEEWEPALCAGVYAALLESIRAVMRSGSGPADLPGKEQHVFEKLARLDPASAIKWSAA